MKITFIAIAFPTVSETFILNQITGLLDLGHDVTVIARLGSGEQQVHADFVKYKLADRISYVPAIPQSKILCRIKTLLLIALNLFRSPRGTLRIVRTALRCKDGFSYSRLYFGLAFLGKKCDVVHCHFGPAGNIGLFLKQAGFAFKLVTTFHGYDVTTYVRQSGSNVYEELFANGDVFTYNSEATKEKMLALGCPEERMIKLPMGVELDKITFAGKKPEPDGSINILSVGRLVEMKGREYAIKAVAQIMQKFENVSYNIAGDGPLREDLEKLIKDLNLADRIHLLGSVSTEELDRLYGRSHIFLHPSVVASNGNTEGQGVVLLEAQAYGMPIVATRHGAFPETVPDGVSGFLVPERNIDALVEKLEYLIKNPDKWLEMGQKGRLHAEKYDINALNRRLVDIYQ